MQLHNDLAGFAKATRQQASKVHNSGAHGQGSDKPRWKLISVGHNSQVASLQLESERQKYMAHVTW